MQLPTVGPLPRGVACGKGRARVRSGPYSGGHLREAAPGTHEGVTMRSRRRVGVLLVAMAGVLSAAVVGSAGPAAAAASVDAVTVDEQALAERFAPVVSLVRQDVECGPGEAFEPSDVGLVLDDRSVALRAPWADDEVVKAGPTAEDLADRLFGYYLDFPGDALEPGCDYERWAGARAASTPPTQYAHVATESGHDERLALQYWFFYPYNDYTNKHEGDWEMAQLVFEAADATQALDQVPVEVGFSQHEGLEVSRWDDPKLEVVDGTHVVVRPAAGSHANFYEEALYLGTSADQGFGCDDTRGPAQAVRPVVTVIPSDPAAARAAFPWVGFEGRWGQREEAFYNGPTGPNTKESWTHPVSDMDEKGREVSYAVPAAGALGTDATDFFCSAVSRGSEIVRALAQNPARLLLILALVTVVVGWVLRRTSWSPVVPLRIARQRPVGQLIRAAGRMYVSRWRLFIGIGVLTVPVSLLVAAGQVALLGSEDVMGVPGGGEGGGCESSWPRCWPLCCWGRPSCWCWRQPRVPSTRSTAAVPIGARGAYRLALGRWRGLLGAFLVASALVGLLSLTVVLTPLAVVLVVLFALFVPVIVFQGSSALASLRRSAALVRHQVWKTVVLLTASILLAGAVGPVLGTILILVTGAPFPVANIVAGATYAALMPFIGLTMAYLYFDARIRTSLARREVRVTEVAPAEIER